MAVRYAVATGNWSNTATWNGGTLPTSADDVYANGYTVTIDQNVTVLSIRNTAQSPAVAGGGFLLSGEFTVNATSEGFIAGITRLLEYTGTNSVLNGSIVGSTTTNINTIYHNSAGNLTISGTLINTANTAVTVVQTNSTGTLNIIGNITRSGRGITLLVNSACTVNIVGSVVATTTFSGGAAIQLNSGIVNITGTVDSQIIANLGYTIVINGLSTLNITGNVDFSSTSANNNHTILFNTSGNLYITGNVSRTSNSSGGAYTIVSAQSSYINIVGNITAPPSPSTATTIISSGASAINIFSGPFICNSYGFLPIQCVRMHLIPTGNSYFEFRDETTNGVVSPGAVAPATRLVSPASVIDAPSPSNVRFGTTYSLGTLTGTLRIPNSNQVAYGVSVDNTTGSAVLTPDAVWNYLVSNITDSGSIGSRLKNVSTPQIMGAQIVGLVKG